MFERPRTPIGIVLDAPQFPIRDNAFGRGMGWSVGEWGNLILARFDGPKIVECNTTTATVALHTPTRLSFTAEHVIFSAHSETEDTVLIVGRDGGLTLINSTKEPLLDSHTRAVLDELRRGASERQ